MSIETVKLTIRLTEDQKNQIHRAASQLDQPLQTFCLNALLDASRKELRDPLLNSQIALANLASSLAIEELLTKFALSNEETKSDALRMRSVIREKVKSKFNFEGDL